jgi:hypothetical protein
MPYAPEQPTQKQLSNGINIRYKAYKRRFLTNSDGAAIFLVATCDYDRNGYTIFFEENSCQWNLMETPPTGIVHFIDNYYIASWSSVLELSPAPAQVTITDAHGQHIVPVEEW